VTGRRYHLLSLGVAVLALALGVGLGAGPVAEESAAERAAEAERLHDRVAHLDGRVTELVTGGERDAEMLTALAAPLTAERLGGRTVLVVAAPGAQAPVVRRVREGLEDAGATITGLLRLTDTYVDPDRAQSPLEDLSLRLVPPGVEFPDGATAIERVGTVLARATVRRPDDEAGESAEGGPGEPPADDVDQDAAEVIAGLDELDALRLDGEPGLRAELAVLVSGPDHSAESEPALTGLLAALDAGSGGAVLAGPGSAEAGAVRWVRDSEDAALDGASTVDSVDGPAGPAVVVLALAQQAAGEQGHYGLGRNAGRVLPEMAPGG
jgi:hypothetical protein